MKSQRAKGEPASIAIKASLTSCLRKAKVVHEERKETMQSYRTLGLFVCSLGLAAPQLAFAADDGAKTYKEVCTQCHTAKVRPLDKKQLTKEQWRQAVAKMVDLGAEVPKDKIPALLDYLASTHGPAGAAGGDGKK